MKTPLPVKYDGVQMPFLEGDKPLHCYTIHNPASPAHGASFCIEADLPTDDQIRDAIDCKEAQFRAAKEAAV